MASAKDISVNTARMFIDSLRASGVDLRLEIHPFSKQEVEQDPPQFFLKIKQEGICIQS